MKPQKLVSIFFAILIVTIGFPIWGQLGNRNINNTQIQQAGRTMAAARLAVAQLPDNAIISVASGFETPSDVCVDGEGNIFSVNRTSHVVAMIPFDGSEPLVVAGRNGQPGSTGDGGSAVEAKLRNPSGCDVGPDGYVYVADTGNHRIRRFRVDGTISRIAGIAQATGSSSELGGFSGDGGPANVAQLNSPEDIAVASDGRVFIADTGNNRIRVFTVGGNIQTVAGGGTSSEDGVSATSAALSVPMGVAVAPSGALTTVYVAEEGSERVRSFTFDGETSSLIETVVGGGEDSALDSRIAGDSVLSGLTKIGVTEGHTLYIAERDRHCVRKVHGNSIQRLAGTGTAGYSVSEDRNEAILAKLSSPEGVAVGPEGRIYIADTDNGRVREVQMRTADLAIEVSAPRGPIDINGTITYDISVSNRGPHTAKNVTLIDTIPVETEFVSSNRPGECDTVGPSTNARLVRCHFGDLSNQGTLRVTISVRVRPYNVSNTVEVTSRARDERSDNSRKVIRTGVGQEAPRARWWW